MTQGTIAITMAGGGSRFVQAGYDRPKYEIEALGRPLFDWAMLSLSAFREAGWRFRFATRAGTAAPFVSSRCQALGIAVDGVLELERQTDGQATTALMLAEQAPAEAPIAIYNIDTFVAPGAMRPPAVEICQGWIPCFAAPGEGWSFVRLGPDGTAVELREKTRISDHATVGLYWFDRADRFVDAYRRYFSKPGREEKGERYVAPLYNQLIEDDGIVRITEIAMSDVGMLGTPEQVAAFVADPPAGTEGLV